MWPILSEGVFGCCESKFDLIFEFLAYCSAYNNGPTADFGHSDPFMTNMFDRIGFSGTLKTILKSDLASGIPVSGVTPL